MNSKPAARGRRFGRRPGRRAGRRITRWIERAIVVATVMIGAVVVLQQDQRLWRLDAMIVDAFQAAKPRAYDPTLPIRIIAIDSESLSRFGQWPWPRPYFGELARQLDALGAAAIAFDFVFAEPDRTSPELFELLRQAPQLATAGIVGRHDTEFAEAISRTNSAIAATPNAAKSNAEPMARKFGLIVAGGDPRPRMLTASGVDEALPVLVEAAKGYGIGGIDVAADGVVRRMSVFRVIGGEISPALPMEALRIAQQAGGYVLRSSDASGESSGGAAPVLVEARNGQVAFPVASDGGVWLRYAGSKPERFLPFWKVFRADPSDAALRAAIEGHIVFVAATAPGLAQPVSTPLGAALPVEIYAELLEQVLSGVTLERPDWGAPAEALALIFLGLITLFAARRRSFLVGAAIAVAGPAAAIAIAWFAFDKASLVLAPLTPAVTALALYALLTAINYIRSLRETNTVRGQFERFVAPAVIQQLIEDPDRQSAMTGEARDLTVLFTDARGFTTLSESMPPDRLISYLNACFGELSHYVLDNRGTIDKYMGDCIMAFWNAPLDDPDQADNGLTAIYQMRRAGARLNAAFQEQGLPTVDFGYGLNAGPCHVGLMGSPERLEYSCVGDTVNVASRLEGLTKGYGVWNIVTESICKATKQDWNFAPLGATAIRGRAETIGIFTLFGPASVAMTPDEAEIKAVLEAIAAATADPTATAAAFARLRLLKADGIDGDRLATAMIDAKQTLLDAAAEKAAS